MDRVMGASRAVITGFAATANARRRVDSREEAIISKLGSGKALKEHLSSPVSEVALYMSMKQGIIVKATAISRKAGCAYAIRIDTSCSMCDKCAENLVGVPGYRKYASSHAGKSRLKITRAALHNQDSSNGMRGLIP